MSTLQECGVGEWGLAGVFSVASPQSAACPCGGVPRDLATPVTHPGFPVALCLCLYAFTMETLTSHETLAPFLPWLLSDRVRDSRGRLGPPAGCRAGGQGLGLGPGALGPLGPRTSLCTEKGNEAHRARKPRKPPFSGSLASKLVGG